MQLYSLCNKALTLDEFVGEYQPMYFITSRNKLIRNKTSHFVEQEIEKILIQGLRPTDLPFVLAWKIGNIKHKASINKIAYKNNCNKTLEFKDRFRIIEHLIC